MVREPLRWRLETGARAGLPQVTHTIRHALLGPTDEVWIPPGWLLAHQVAAARRLAAKLSCFRGALLADAPGLGKTYVGLALATRYPQAIALVPAALVAQWRTIAAAHDVKVTLLSHEAVSRGARIPSAELLVVDEAHRFRNPRTRRYDVLARRAPGAHLLLLTATPVVNHAADLVHLLRLFLPDHGLAAFGVPSIERAVASRAFGELAHGYAAMVVARTAELSPAVAGAMPVTTDAAVVTPPTAPPSLLRRLAAGTDALEFPSFGGPEAAALLRLHLLVRLASSVAAFSTTLHRHRRYLDHAIAAARRGEPVSRRHAWRVLGPDDLQLDLPGLVAISPAPPLDTARLESERHRIQSLIDTVGPEAHPDPKADALQHLLGAHEGKTIVFTGAVATARHLARRLGWRRVGLATGHGARIATGAVTLNQLLALFAPESQQAPAVPPSLRLDTLIATDLVSEGLNLQDANGVIHYDLPWSPLRLKQRVGRVARLGSRHALVRVAWFLPPGELERRLAFAARIAAKVREQLHLGVAASSQVGRAHIRGDLFEWRERFLEPRQDPPAAAPHFAVVRSGPAAVFSIRWTCAGADVPAIVVMEGDPPLVVRDERRAAAVVRRLVYSPVSPEPPPTAPLLLLQHEVRTRLAALEGGPRDDATRRLARRIVRRARVAGRARNQPLIMVLDLALERLIVGLPVGGARTLADHLDDPASLPQLRARLSCSTTPAPPCPGITLDAALFGVPAVAREHAGLY